MELLYSHFQQLSSVFFLLLVKKENQRKKGKKRGACREKRDKVLDKKCGVCYNDTSIPSLALAGGLCCQNAISKRME
jgi:hypothetical protein